MALPFPSSSDLCFFFGGGSGLGWDEPSGHQRSFRFCRWHGHRLLPPVLSLWDVCFLTSQILPDPVLQVPQYICGPPYVFWAPGPLLLSLPDQILSVHRLLGLNLHSSNPQPLPCTSHPPPQSLLFSLPFHTSCSVLLCAALTRASTQLSGPRAAGTPHVPQQQNPGLLLPLFPNLPVSRHPQGSPSHRSSSSASHCSCL